MNIIDIGDEILRFANDQGHRKASKDTINWNGLKTKSGLVKFTTESLKFSSAPYKAASGIVTNAECLYATQVSQQTTSAAESTARSMRKNEIYFEGNKLRNDSDEDRTCNTSFTSFLSSTAEARIKLNSTIAGPQTTKRNSITRVNKSTGNGFRLKQIPQAATLANISLSPKFRTKLSVSNSNVKKFQLPIVSNKELAITVPGHQDIPVTVIEHREEEKGLFEFDYYLWGSVEVTVWGKPYTLMVTDVLDSKYNSLFQRENIETHKFQSENVQVSKIKLYGSYESVKVFYQVQVEKISSNKELSCTCNTVKIPKNLSSDTVQVLDDRNLAYLIFNIKNTFSSLKGKEQSDKRRLLWINVKKHSSAFGTTAQAVERNKTYSNLTVMDKITVTILLWRSGNYTGVVKDIKINHNKELHQSTIQLVNYLNEVGISAKTLCFLWRIDSNHICPIHDPSITTPTLKDFHPKTQTKLTKLLPDRVLIRLANRWPDNEGWIAAALHLGIDILNITNLISNKKTIASREEKLITVFKLWRITYRRNNIATESRNSEIELSKCTIWDLCMELHAMQIPTSVYNFLWKDCETTP